MKKFAKLFFFIFQNPNAKCTVWMFGARLKVLRNVWIRFVFHNKQCDSNIERNKDSVCEGAPYINVLSRYAT